MRKEFGGTGTPFGYTDPDVYQLGYDGVFDTHLGYIEAEVLIEEDLADPEKAVYLGGQVRMKHEKTL